MLFKTQYIPLLCTAYSIVIIEDGLLDCLSPSLQKVRKFLCHPGNNVTAHSSYSECIHSRLLVCRSFCLLAKSTS